MLPYITSPNNARNRCSSKIHHRTIGSDGSRIIVSDEPNDRSTSADDDDTSHRIISESPSSMGKIMPFSDSHVVVKPMDSLLHSYTATTAASETGAFLALAEQGRQAQRTGNVQTAFQYYRKAIQYKKQSIESESLEIKQVYAGILFELGWMYDTSLQEPETSSELLHQCLDLRIEIYGHDHIDVAIVLYKLAEIHERLNELEYSYNLILEALAIMLDKADAIVLSAMWTALGRIQKALGQTEDAQSSLMAAQAGSSSKSSSSTASNNPDNTPVTTTTTTTTTSSPTTMLRTT